MEGKQQKRAQEAVMRLARVEAQLDLLARAAGAGEKRSVLAVKLAAEATEVHRILIELVAAGAGTAADANIEGEVPA